MIRAGAQVWIRRVTLWLIVMVALVLVGIATQRTRGHGRRALEVTVPDASVLLGTEGEGEAVGVYQGFEYTESISGNTIFVLSADRTTGLASGWHEIEGVSLKLYRDNRTAAVLSCDRASFNIQTRDARVEGAVHVDFGDGGFINTDRGRFDAASRSFVSDGKVFFAAGGAVGQAESAAFALERDEVRLEGDVVIQLEGKGALFAPLVVYARKAARVKMPRGCRLEAAGYSLEAPKALFKLEEVDGRPHSVELTEGVDITGDGGGGRSILTGWAERITADRDPSGRWHVSASSTSDWVRFDSLEIATSHLRTLRTWRLRAALEAEGSFRARAEGVVCIEDLPLDAPPRRAEAERALLWFRDGALEDLELRGGVVLHGEGMRATGATARMMTRSRLILILGDELGRERAVMTYGGSRIASDQVQILEHEGRAEARGDVQGAVDQGPGMLVASSAGGGGGRLRFAADGLDVLEGGDVFHLKGNARAWDGGRLLLADEIVYGRRDESLSASGSVRTVLPGEEVNEGSNGGESVDITARSLDYSRESSMAVYRGDVRLSDPLHVMSAAELQVVMDDDGKVTFIDALGGVDIVDLAADHRITGDRAHYDSELRTVVVTGDPVHSLDAMGNAVSGSSLTWDQASGTVTVSGDPNSPSETIYRPEEQP